MDTKEAPAFIAEADQQNGCKIENGFDVGRLKDVNGVDAARLLSIVERIETLEEEKKALQNDIKEIFEEAENRGFDKKALKEVLKRRKMDENDARELDFSVEVYKKALGMD